jgi:hypothetical protein
LIDPQQQPLALSLDTAAMPVAPAQPHFRSAAHRRAVMQHIGATLLPVAFSFGVIAPMIGLALIWGSTFVAMVCNVITTGGATFPSALETVFHAVAAGYLASGVAAAISGVWVALFSPFVDERPRFYSGAAIIGMMNAFLFVSPGTAAAGIFGGQLFIALVGAVSAFLCTWLIQDVVLKRDDLRRDQLAAERAERLAKERAAAKRA